MNDHGADFDLRWAGWEPGILTSFTAFLGQTRHRTEGDEFRTGMLAQPQHINQLGNVDNGVILTFADYALGTATSRIVPKSSQMTIQLTTMLMLQAQLGDFIEGRAEVVRTSSSLIFVRGILSVGDRPIACSEGVFKIVKPLVTIES